MENNRPIIKLALTFNAEIFTTQNALAFDYFWAKYLKKVKIKFVYIVLMGVMATFLLYYNKPFGFVMIGFCILSLANIIDFYFSYQKKLKIFESARDSEIENYKNSLVPIVWQFFEDYFQYTDHRMTIKLSWEQVKGMRLIERNLFLEVQSGIQISFMPAKSEVGKAMFDKVITFLNKKNIT